MNLSKEHFDMYNEYTLNINKIKYLKVIDKLKEIDKINI